VHIYNALNAGRVSALVTLVGNEFQEEMVPRYKLLYLSHTSRAYTAGIKIPCAKDNPICCLGMYTTVGILHS